MVSPLYLVTDAEESNDREQEAYFSSQNTFQFFFRIILFFFFRKKAYAPIMQRITSEA